MSCFALSEPRFDQAQVDHFNARARQPPGHMSNVILQRASSPANWLQ